MRKGHVETVSRRAHPARQSRLSTKHVGFRHHCARAPTRGGGDAGDRSASSSPRLSATARSAWASLALVYKLWCGEVDMPATVSRRASSCVQSASAQNEARGLPVLLCASFGTKKRLGGPPTCVKLYPACLPRSERIPLLRESFGTRRLRRWPCRRLFRVELPSGSLANLSRVNRQ